MNRDITEIRGSNRKVELVTPTGDRTGIFFELREPDCPQILQVERAYENALIRARGKLKSAEREKLKTDRIVAGVEGWDFEDEAMTINGEHPSFAESALRRLIRDIPWVRRFLDQEMADEMAFFEASNTV